MKVPQQPNAMDCALYTVHHAEVFASDPEAVIAEVKVSGMSHVTVLVRLNAA
jgi:Ulp1 family protease